MALIEGIALVGNVLHHKLIAGWFSCTGNPTTTHYCKEAYLDSLGSGKGFQLALIGCDLKSITEATSLIEQTISNAGPNCYVVALSSTNTEQEVVAALNAGADRFLNTYTSFAVNNARIYALVRPLLRNNIEYYPPYTMNHMTNVATVAGTRIQLTPSEFRIAKYLFDNSNNILSREIMLREIWGLPNLEYSRRVDTKISHIRRKMSLDGTYGWRLNYPRGKGYQLLQSALIASP